MADRYCSVRFKTGEELDKALAAALCSCDDAARAEAAAARAEEIQTKIDETVAEALTQAKESGEFDGPAGPAGNDGKNGLDGYTPQRGVDYWTESDVAEIKSYVDENAGGGIAELPDSVPRIEEKASSVTLSDAPEHYFNALGDTWWKVSDFTFSTEELLHTVFSVVAGEGSPEVMWTPTEEEVMLDSEEVTGLMSFDGLMFAVCRVTGEHEVMGSVVNIPATGIYMAYTFGEPVPEFISVGVSYTELHKLDARLLPDGFETLVNGYIDEYLEKALSGEY